MATRTQFYRPYVGEGGCVPCLSQKPTVRHVHCRLPWPWHRFPPAGKTCSNAPCTATTRYCTLRNKHTNMYGFHLKSSIVIFHSVIYNLLVNDDFLVKERVVSLLYSQLFYCSLYKKTAVKVDISSYLLAHRYNYLAIIIIQCAIIVIIVIQF
jgi:hypothetical protein